jgi:DNA-binding transcriptional MerR regulator
MENALPAIPPKRYFTIGEVSELCGVKPYVLRYWEQEFTQLRPMKRRGNRRYYQHHEVLLIRRIRDLLYEQGFTISGARNRLSESGSAAHAHDAMSVDMGDDSDVDVDHEIEPPPPDGAADSRGIDGNPVVNVLTTADRPFAPSAQALHISTLNGSPGRAVAAGAVSMNNLVLKHELELIRDILDTGVEHEFMGILSVSVGA